MGGADQGTSVQVALGQRAHHLLLVAGQLQVHVQLHVGVVCARQVVQALLQCQRLARRGVLVVVREHQRPVRVRDGSTSNSIMSTPWASAASKLAVVLPGATWSAPLCPTLAFSSGYVAQAYSPGTRRWCGCRRPGRGPRSSVPQRRQGRPGALVDPGALPPGRPCCAPTRRTSAGGRSRPARAASSSPTCGRGLPRVEPGQEARLRLPDVADAGQVALVQQGIADAAGAVVLAHAASGTARSSNSAPARRARGAARWGSKRVRESVVSSSTGPSNCTTSWSSVRMTSHARRRATGASARRGGRRPTCRSCAGASAASGHPRSG